MNRTKNVLNRQCVPYSNRKAKDEFTIPFQKGVYAAVPPNNGTNALYAYPMARLIGYWDTIFKMNLLCDGIHYLQKQLISTLVKLYIYGTCRPHSGNGATGMNCVF